MSQTCKKPKKSRKIYTWIRERISSYCFGVKTKAGNPAHCNKNDDILYQFQCLKMGWYGRRLSRLKNKDMADHFAGKKTYYFTADGRSRTPEVLVNIDIDCHKSGTIQGAIAFAEHLKATKFPNLYFEASTNGNGVHGYLVVLKRSMGDEGLNLALGQLDLWLKAELSKGSWDVEDVEVKAHCPEFTWGNEKYELKTYKSGQLAKLPREALTRADELRGTTRVVLDVLRRLKVSTKDVESEDSVVCMKKKSATKKPSVVSVSGNGNWEKRASVVPPKVERKSGGSISGLHFDEDELSRLKEGYLSLASELLAGEVLVASGRKVVIEQDMAIFLMLLKFFTSNMNANGSLPTARWREMWKALFEAGDVGRAWCHHRFARMRNFLSDKDLIAWEDENFIVGVLDQAVGFVPGRAAKWRAGKELLTMMDRDDEQDDFGVDGERDVETKIGESRLVSEVGVPDQVHHEEREERESILYGCKHQGQGQAEEKEEVKSILYGHTPFVIPVFNPKLRQSTSFLEDLSHLGIEMPLQRPRFTGYSTSQYRMAA